MEEEEWPDGWNGGQWLIPEIQTDETGIKCDVQTERDAAYIVNAIKSLEYLGVNTSAIFFTGCSMGSAMTVWIAQCMHKRTPAAVSAFASFRDAPRRSSGSRLASFTSSRTVSGTAPWSEPEPTMALTSGSSPQNDWLILMNLLMKISATFQKMAADICRFL